MCMLVMCILDTVITLLSSCYLVKKTRNIQKYRNLRNIGKTFLTKEVTTGQIFFLNIRQIWITIEKKEISILSNEPLEGKMDLLEPFLVFVGYGLHLCFAQLQPAIQWKFLQVLPSAPLNQWEDLSLG